MQGRRRSPSQLRGEDMPSYLRYHEGTFKNTRNQTLAYCALFPAKNTPLCGVFLFLHGLGDHCRRYFHVYQALCNKGFGVITYDFISHGLSQCCAHNVRHHARHFTYFVDDTNAFITHAQYEIYAKMAIGAPHPPLIIGGASFGTLVAVHTVLSGHHKFQALVVVGPTMSMQWTRKLRITTTLSRPLALLLPRTRVVASVQPERMSRDPAYVEDYGSDPLTKFPELTARMGAEVLHAVHALAKDPRLEMSTSNVGSLSVLFMMGTEDHVASMENVIHFYRRLGNKDKLLKLFQGAYHALFDDPAREEAVAFLLMWLKDRFAFDPSTSSGSTYIVRSVYEL